MGNVMCQCLVNESKDKQGGNISIDDLNKGINNIKNNNDNMDKLKNLENTLSDHKEDFNQKTGTQKFSLKKYKQEQNNIHNIEFSTNTDSKKNEKNNYYKPKIDPKIQLNDNNNNNNKNFNINNNNNKTNNNNNNTNTNNNNTNSNSIKYKNSSSDLTEGNNNNNNYTNTNSNQNNKENSSIKPELINLMPKKNSNEKYIAIYGPEESGKTSFVLKYCNNKFDNFYIPSFEEEITNKNCVINTKPYKLKFTVCINTNQIVDADCYFIFYDMSSQSSLNSAIEILDKKIKYFNKQIFFIGNKSDSKVKLDESKLKEIISKNKIKCEIFSISVKDNIGIAAMMSKFKEIFSYE